MCSACPQHSQQERARALRRAAVAGTRTGQRDVERPRPRWPLGAPLPPALQVIAGHKKGHQASTQAHNCMAGWQPDWLASVAFGWPLTNTPGLNDMYPGVDNPLKSLARQPLAVHCPQTQARHFRNVDSNHLSPHGLLPHRRRQKGGRPPVWRAGPTQGNPIGLPGGHPHRPASTPWDSA